MGNKVIRKKKKKKTSLINHINLNICIVIRSSSYQTKY